MKEYHDPIYFQSRTTPRPESSLSSRPVKKSHSVAGSSGSSVLGRFLKLGKTNKSDGSGGSKRASSCYGDDLEEDFRLSPSVLNRGPVERMVNNARKDVSRSHSWIYGSVKLPSDLPFGYGYGYGSSGNSPVESDSSASSPNHTHPLSAVQIPRCQMSEFHPSQGGGCECSNDLNYALVGNGKPCQACAFEWTLTEKKSRKLGSEGGKTFVDSVRKLTWKSLKQVVKKRPSIDGLKKSNAELRVGGFDAQQIPLELLSPNSETEMHARFFDYTQQSAFSAEDFTPSYFFPEKKGVYASCSELFRDNVPHATASVRVRPKPSRQSWHFSNDAGPVPNYQEESSVYHSEWDLRQCIPYDVWVNTTSHVKSRAGVPPPRSKTPVKEPTSRNSSLSKSTSVPYLAEAKASSTKSLREDGILKVKSSSSGTVNHNNSDTISLRSVASSVKTAGSCSGKQKNGGSNGVAKRPSILAADANAYQLLKSQTKPHSIGSAGDQGEDAISTSSDDLSDNALSNESHMRIAGQRIYMPSNPKGVESTGKVRNANSGGNNRNKKIAMRKGNLSSGDQWSDEIERHEASLNRAEILQQSHSKGKSSQAQSIRQNGAHPSHTLDKHESVREIERIRSNPIQQYFESNKESSSRINGNANYNNQSDGHSSQQRDYYEENYQVEFEEYVFEEKGTTPTPKANKANNAVRAPAGILKSHKSESASFNGNNDIVLDIGEKQSQASFMGNRTTSGNAESKEVSLSNSVSGNGAGKFGALRRRKSRNGSSNPGKLMREVIYEEEVEQEHPSLEEPSLQSSHQQKAQGSPKVVDQHAVKIVVPHSTGVEYVKPILKNRERVYDAPNNQINSVYQIYSSAQTDHNNDIYFDSSASTTSTLKKRVQFDHNKVIVCGGDSGPDSDDYGIDNDDNEGGSNRGEKSYSNDDQGNYHNEENTVSDKDSTSNQAPHYLNESGSVSVTLNLTRKSALKEQNSGSNQLQKSKSSFEQEVARKAASLALSRKSRQVSDTANDGDNDDPLVNTNDLKKECFDVPKVNNLIKQQATNVSVSGKAPKTGGSVKEESPKLTNSKAEEMKGRHFIKNAKASHGVASQIMKAKRIASAANGKSPASLVNGSSVPKDKEKIVNPNSLLFNDTTRIRLNQSRPSLNDTFKLNLSQNGQANQYGSSTGGKGVRLKQSSSFRSALGSAPLRPREPPPPPPPAVKSSSTSNLKMTISSQLEKMLTKTSSVDKIYSNLNGNRLLSKSEISLPIDLQTTSNQASHVIKNQNTHERKANSTSINSHRHNVNGTKSEGNGNGVKNPVKSHQPNSTPKRNGIDGHNANNCRTSANKCEAVAAPTKSSTSLNHKIAKTNNIATPAKSEQIKKGNAKAFSAITNANKKTSNQKSDLTEVSPPQAHGAARHEERNIEIVTKANAVSEIRIYSGTSSIVQGEEIHYASTDVFPQNKQLHNNATQEEPIVIPSRPQSTSVVVIVDKREEEEVNCSKVRNVSSSPLTYSQPVDALSKRAASPPPAPVTPEPQEGEEEPLYDDVVHHKAADKVKNGSLGRKFLMASLSSMNPVKKQLSLFQGGSSLSLNSVSSNSSAQLVSSTLPCLACPPSLPPPNLPAKSLSEYTTRPVVLEDEALYCDSGAINDKNIDEEVDNLYNDISYGSSNQGSNKSFASGKGSLLISAIKGIDFDKRSVISGVSNHSGGSGTNDPSCNLDNFIYDDTLSLRSGASDGSKSQGQKSSVSRFSKFFDSSSLKSNKSSPPAPPSILSNSSTIKYLANVEEKDEKPEELDPIYDDVINYKKKGHENSNSSDSGAESEDAVPPPLPAQGPPKITTELPLLTFPLLANRTVSNNSEEKVIDIIIPPMEKGSQNGASMSQCPESVLTKTRSLLNELNEKLTQLNSLTAEVASSSSNNKGLSPLDLPAYSPNKDSKVPSSSASSGVEEDYNSEKNYSLSNSSDAASGSGSSGEDNYRLAQVTKLVTETITMARGKFLDSMKSQAFVNTSAMLSGDSRGDSGSSPCSEEPIYEEIGDMNRSHSPIYADAFDAKSIFDGASRSEILCFLESIRDRLVTSDSNSSGSQSSSISSKKGQDSNHNYLSSAESSSNIPGDLCPFSLPTHLEEETEELESHGSQLILRKLCSDCNDTPVQEEGRVSREEAPHQTVCNACNRKRSERREIITEIHETEMKYGRDLKIITDEFYKPIQIAGLLNKEQLDQIFLNVDELMTISAQLTSLLKTEIQAATAERNDEELFTVNVGKIFLEIGEIMMLAFQSYCTRQANAGALLAQHEKEKELLRIFLRVSQMENAVLRRMNLPAFLMVPVQRVTRYPLLLSRLLKVTPVDHFSRDELQSAHEKIEQHLEHMNKATREVASVKLWRRISIINGNTTPITRRSNNELEGATVSIRKMATDILDWSNLTDIHCILDSQLALFYVKGKPLEGVFACLLVRGKDLETLVPKMDNDMFFPPAEDIVKEVKLVLVRVKNTRFCPLREPLCLSTCVVSQGENEFQDFVEINEITSKNTYHLQGMDKKSTAEWLKFLQCYSMCVGQWRKRRRAKENIMLNHI